MTELLGQETSLNTLEESSPEDDDEEDEDDDDDENEDDDDDEEVNDSKVIDIDGGKDSSGSLNHGRELLTGQVLVPPAISPEQLLGDDANIDKEGKECKRRLTSSDASLSCIPHEIESDKRVREN